MHPVESRTGAIRLEDPRAGAMWLQLGNKSMLMSQKQGLRLADECQAAEQMAFAEDMKKNPPKSLFDGSPPPTHQAVSQGAALPVARAATPICDSRRKKMLQAYVDHVAERAALGIPPLPLRPSRPPN